MYRRSLLIFLCLMTFLLLTWQHDHSFRHERPLTLNGKPPLVIGHRGASGYRPEHTLASYELAIELGADVVEPDLVMTKDGVLICRHEPMLSMTTNVANISKFAHKRTWRSVAGIKYYDWFASDFTLKEIKELRAIQTRFNRSHAYDGLYQVPTYDEVIALVKAKEAQYNRVIRTYPEIKEPSYHKRLGLPITDTLLKTLEREGWTHKDSPVFIQCFEVATLQYVRSRTNAPIVQLIIGDDVDKYGNIVAEPPNVKPYDFVLSGDPRTYNDLIKNKGLDFIKTYADGIGVWSAFIIPFTFQDKNHDSKPDDLNGDGRIDNRDYFALNPTDLIQRAHKRDLFVHGYTYRNDPSQLLSTYHGNPLKEYRDHYRLGVDGVFSDFADTAIKARNELF